MTTTLMQGFPPITGTQVDLSNWRKPPFNRWAYSHVNEIVPSATIFNDPKAINWLNPSNIDLSHFNIEQNGEHLNLSQWLEQTYTDGIVILRKGELIFEQYFGEMNPYQPHILMSISKSVLGLIYGIMAEKLNLNLATEISTIIPEIKGSAFEGASLRDLLDMRVGIEFDENYHATGGAIIAYRKAQGWEPLESNDPKIHLREFFPTLTATDGEHNQRFHYVSPNTDLLGWAIERLSGKRFADLVTEYLWKPMGAEQNGYITVDKIGTPRCAGGINFTTRDLARLGRLFVTGGRANDKQIVPEQWIDDILTSGDKSAWDNGDFYEFYDKKSMHYRSKWYVEHGDYPMVFGLGVFGQNLFIEPNSDLVIAKFSSQPLPLDENFNRLTHKGIDKLREILR